MLQWMGGSRHKVTTKQYFDQRKRQQLKQQAVEERVTDGSNPFTHQDNNRSLDILSLLNLSTVVENFNSSCYSVTPAIEEIDGGNLVLDCHMSKGQPVIQTAKVTLEDSSGFREEEYLPAGQVENLYPTEFLSGNHDIQTRDSIIRSKLKLDNERCCQAETKCEKKTSEDETVEPIRGGDRKNNWKKANGMQSSMFDLLGDDGSNGNDEENRSCEAHVAFSMEGLGEMGSETPVHSPEQPVRLFSYNSVSPVKSRRQLQFSKNLDDILYDLELETAAVAQNTELPLYGSSPLCGSSFEAPLFSEGIYNPFGKAKEMSSCSSDSWRFAKKGGKSKNYFADDETFWEIDNGTDDKWNGPPEDCYTLRKNSPLRKDGISADIWNIGVKQASDFNFLGSVPKIRVSEKTRKSSISESANPYCKQRRIEKDNDLRASAAWPSYLTEDVEDSLSLCSEESCSSTAGYSCYKQYIQGFVV